MYKAVSMVNITNLLTLIPRPRKSAEYEIFKILNIYFVINISHVFTKIPDFSFEMEKKIQDL